MEKKNHLELIERYTQKYPYRVRMAKVKCDCGNVKDVQYWAWERGKIKSCGCMRLGLLSESVKPSNPIYSHRLHNIWSGMKQRCYNPKSENWHNYGGRGIKICRAWKNDYTKFYEWALSHGYKDDLTIDRIDVNKGYSPRNCRWATAKEQAENKRPWNKFRHKEKFYVDIDGERCLISEICREYGVSVATYKYRFNKMGKTPLEALTMDKECPGRPKSSKDI